MKKLLLALIMATFSANSQEMQRVIEEGTVIKIAIDYDVSGKELKAGDKIDFTTTEDLIQGNFVVLHKGLKVVGTVTEAAKSKGLGKKGKLSFSIDYLYLTDGKVIKLRNEIKKNINGSGGVVAASSIVLTPIALFIHGKNAKYKKGDLFEAFVSEKTIL